jgi:hypothetical protein
MTQKPSRNTITSSSSVMDGSTMVEGMNRYPRGVGKIPPISDPRRSICCLQQPAVSSYPRLKNRPTTESEISRLCRNVKSQLLSLDDVRSSYCRL